MSPTIMWYDNQCELWNICISRIGLGVDVWSKNTIIITFGCSLLHHLKLYPPLGFCPTQSDYFASYRFFLCSLVTIVEWYRNVYKVQQVDGDIIKMKYHHNMIMLIIDYVNSVFTPLISEFPISQTRRHETIGGEFVWPCFPTINVYNFVMCGNIPRWGRRKS